MKSFESLIRYLIRNPAVFRSGEGEFEDMGYRGAPIGERQRHTGRMKYRTLRGVPARRFDVVILSGTRAFSHQGDWVLEIGLYTGPFGGDPRTRYLVYPMWRDDYRPVEPGMVRVEIRQENGRVLIVLADSRDVARDYIDDCTESGYTTPRLVKSIRPDADIFHTDEFETLPDVGQDYNLEQIVWWHAHRYFGFLVQSELVHEVKAIAAAFSVPERTSLASANRLASRRLYSLARECGWVKLTTNQQNRLGCSDGPQWRRTEDVDRMIAETCGFSVDGLSQATHRASYPGGTFSAQEN